MRDNEMRNRGQTFREEYKESIAVIAADVSVDIGDTVTRNSTVRRVMDTGNTGDGLQLILHLGKRYGGA